MEDKYKFAVVLHFPFPIMYLKHIWLKIYLKKSKQKKNKNTLLSSNSKSGLFGCSCY